MPEGSPSPWAGPPVALLWDQSLVWGLICIDTLQTLGVPFHLLNGRDIADGCLDHYRVLVAPGGWASHKMRALGDEGRGRIIEFVEGGGSYLGFCGGAGLALSSPPALGIVPLERMPISARLPNASGEVWIEGVPGHPAWKGLPRSLPVSIWWPSQFDWQPLPRTLCLGTYAATGADFWVADLPVCDLEEITVPWEEWEAIYGINLNPRRLLGHPALMEVRIGKGRLILSYPHLETPDNRWGNRLFLNILTYLESEASKHLPRQPAYAMPPSPLGVPPGREAMSRLIRASEAAGDLIRFGERHLLWKWRLPWLLNWRRGIRGLEYGTLAVALRSMVEAGERAQEIRGGTETRGITAKADAEPVADPWIRPARQLDEDVKMFCRMARQLLLEEKLATRTGSLTKLGSVNQTVDRLRGHLFGTAMNHGGLCRTLFDEMDALLLPLLRLSGR